jgi:hypothetical protein
VVTDHVGMQVPEDHLISFPLAEGSDCTPHVDRASNQACLLGLVEFFEVISYEMNRVLRIKLL